MPNLQVWRTGKYIQTEFIRIPAALTAIAAATGIALAAKRRREEEEREQAERVRAEVEAKNAALEAARRAKMEALKARNWLMGQAMLQNALTQSGLSQAEQERVRAESRMKGVSAALGLMSSLEQAAQARLEASWRAMEEKLRRVDEWEERRQRERERQQQQAHSTWDMARWKERDYAESARWETERKQRVYQDYRQQEWADPQPLPQSTSQPKSWWQRVGEAATHPVQIFENAMIAWGRRSETGRKVIRFLTDRVTSLNDPVRNPITNAFGQSIRDGWAGLTYGVSSTLHLAGETLRSIGKGDWERAKRYGGAWLEGTIKGWLWGGIQTTAQLIWGAIKMATPIGLFETVPSWRSAIKEAWAGKRGGWDVALTSLFLMANLLGIAGAASGVKTTYDIRAFQDTLSPSAQLEYTFLPRAEQIRILNAAKSAGASPAAIEFYLSQIGRPASPLSGLPLADALKVSSLAAESGRGPFILDYVGRYGFTDALKIATPEVIRGMTSDQFLVQAQEILSQDMGYNVTPESVFTNYPGSTIGKNSTFITNEAAIRNIIGDFHGTKIIYVTYDQAVALANALGLDSVSLIDGFRISKISNLGGLDLSYPLRATNPLFRGPGQGLPGGGTEITINPPVLMDSPNVVDQIIIKVSP